MKLEEALSAIECCGSLPELKQLMQRFCDDSGFCSYNFLDIGNPHVDVPFYMGTTGEAWETDYRTNGFVHVDHCVAAARRTNLAFSWDEVPAAPRQTGPKSGAARLMEAAADHGFQNGLVVPFHYRDKVGRYHSSLAVFYWKNSVSSFRFMMKRKKTDLQILIIYWVQKAVDLVSAQRGNSDQFGGGVLEGVAHKPLTDREKDVLAWAARGKTIEETADILSISGETVTTHLRSSMRKLDASNKTHAAVRAVYLGLIDV